ncbi:uncharacterized protein A4U43_C03F5930 [Asparagus officinalis]|uniref:Uncharacterized protein n=1 Tax=Asparagus officinalis TaxID=4686 RepID=A0A5P1FCY5_ASPOF|nr:uncharacterized protein A4U43_C03F5930 [Asparagus officinalis]
MNNLGIITLIALVSTPSSQILCHLKLSGLFFPSNLTSHSALTASPAQHLVIICHGTQMSCAAVVVHCKAQHHTVPVRQPVHGSNINSLGTIEATVETRMACSWEGENKLSRILKGADKLEPPQILELMETTV